MNKVTQRKNFKTISPKTETESDKKVKDSYKNTASIFLEIIQNLKNYVMEIMDMKICQSQQPNPQMMFQQPYFPNQHTTPKHGSFSGRCKHVTSTESCLLSKAVSPARISKNCSHWISNNSLYKLSFFRNVVSESNQIDSLKNTQGGIIIIIIHQALRELCFDAFSIMISH